jgi:hypothetical protein
MTTLVTTAPAEPGKLALLPPVALVVDSAVGGVFNLPRDTSAGAAPGAVVTGWLTWNGAVSPL